MPSGTASAPPTLPQTVRPTLSPLPTSQRSTASSAASSRRASLMLPPSLPSSSPISQTLPNDPNVGPGPGPQRLPRPLTAADLHLQLEREQEAVVNRLTRELTLLRSHSHSHSISSADDPNAPAGSIPIPTSHPTQRLRSGSTTSSINIPLAPASLSRTNSIRTGRSSPHPGDMFPIGTPPSNAPLFHSSNPQYPSPHHHAYAHPYSHHHVGSFSSSIDGKAGGNLAEIRPESALGMSSSVASNSGNLELAVKYKRDLEAAKLENEQLRTKVKDLEKMVRDLVDSKERNEMNKGRRAMDIQMEALA
ncbi:hypothetical protein BJ508DRAFT_413890 [Ascobolus immersus RN42]|uniref:Uncharacterized protein n=1 Tax=Ascobolus immersus RN42 TaxID=1160509 RepID=A0A3N4IEZ2_ASCIM|nr:hypothetical protein BJ508DRAFT_413890 [Ascobolus immersus RN42]